MIRILVTEEMLNPGVLKRKVMVFPGIIYR